MQCNIMLSYYKAIQYRKEREACEKKIAKKKKITMSREMMVRFVQKMFSSIHSKICEYIKERRRTRIDEH